MMTRNRVGSSYTVLNCQKMRSLTFRLLAPLWIVIITCTSYTNISIFQSKLLPKSSNADQQESLEYTAETDEQEISKNVGIDAEDGVYTDGEPLQLRKEETEKIQRGAVQ